MTVQSETAAPITRESLASGIAKTAFAFRGYNQKNLGKTPELLEHPVYGSTVEKYLTLGSEICSEVMDLNVDLVARVRSRVEPTLQEYHEAITMVSAVELAQIEILKSVFDVSLNDADMMYGFSLGELTALVAGGVLTMKDSLSIPLQMSRDAALLAEDVTLAIVFSRSDKLIPRENVNRLCADINREGKGVIGVSAFLAPNSMLMMGQGDTIQRFKDRKDEITEERVSVRLNEGKWPPLHTPIVWQKNITNRSQFLMHTIESGLSPPSIPLLSLATGEFSYDGVNTRKVVGKWIDQPQLLWEAVDTTLLRGEETIIHVGPEPNIIPATFSRLATNVQLQTKDRMGMKTLSTIARQGWLSAILPKRANLLRAPHIRHVILEDWLLAQDEGGGNSGDVAAGDETKQV